MNEGILTGTRRLLMEAVTTDRRITPAGDWLLDNFYLIEEQISPYLLPTIPFGRGYLDTSSHHSSLRRMPFIPVACHGEFHCFRKLSVVVGSCIQMGASASATIATQCTFIAVPFTDIVSII